MCPQRDISTFASCRDLGLTVKRAYSHHTLTRPYLCNKQYCKFGGHRATMLISVHMVRVPLNLLILIFKELYFPRRAFSLEAGNVLPPATALCILFMVKLVIIALTTLLFN